MRWVHIAAGLTALLAGAVALGARKGADVHRKSGMIFVYTMLLMSGTGALLSILRSQHLNAAMGVLTFYFVVTALRAVRPRVGGFPWVDVAAMLVALAVGVYELGLGVQAVRSPKGQIDGAPYPPVFIFATLALLAALGDLRMMAKRGLQGAQRLARHLWRMCTAMFIATGSLFLGQPRVFPKALRMLPLRAIPVLVVLVFMLYWLARVLVTHRRRPDLLRH